MLLETAAYADLMCHALENPLKTWTLDFIGVYTGSADIRSELERIRDYYKSQLGTETRFDTMDNRVPFYAEQLPAQFNRALEEQEALGEAGRRVYDGMCAATATIRVDVTGEGGGTFLLNIDAGRMSASSSAA